MPDVAPRPDTPQTLAGWVDTRLRTAILTGELRAGEKLRGEHLALEWGVSPTPLREAFQRLAGEGLVEIEPQRGARVAGIDADQAAESYELRLMLDPAALSASMTAADPSFHDDVGRAHAELLAATGSVAEHLAAHRAFHMAVLSRCPNRQLLELCAQLHDRTQRFQVTRAMHRTDGDPRSEHHALCDAVLAGDIERATAVLTAHLDATLQSVRRAADAVVPASDRSRRVS